MATKFETITAQQPTKEKVIEIANHIKETTGMANVSMNQALDVMAAAYWTLNKRSEKTETKD
jgi:hypothetical protein